MKKLLILLTIIGFIAIITVLLWPRGAKAPMEVEAPKVSAKIADTNLYLALGGQILEGQYQNLPTIYLPGKIQVQSGQTLQDMIVLKLAKIAFLLSKSDFQATAIRVLDSQDIVAYDAKDTIVIFSKEGSEDKQVDSLQQVLARAKMVNAQIAKIDLRFDNPVITYR